MLQKGSLKASELKVISCCLDHIGRTVRKVHVTQVILLNTVGRT
jgi:hypothetical protein